MLGPSASTFVPFLVLLIILATDLWVYVDAKAQSERGTPVFLEFGAFRIETPTGWLFGCVFLWIVFFPLYVTARGR